MLTEERYTEQFADQLFPKAFSCRRPGVASRAVEGWTLGKSPKYPAGSMWDARSTPILWSALQYALNESEEMKDLFKAMKKEMATLKGEITKLKKKVKNNSDSG